VSDPPALEELTIERRDSVVVANLSGEIDIANAEALGDALARAVPNHAHGLVLDLTRTSYIDSSGIRVLFATDERLRRRGQRLRVVLPTDALIRRALVMTGVDTVIPLDATAEQALEELDGEPG
jgi:anti-anti-sigma factor